MNSEEVKKPEKEEVLNDKAPIGQEKIEPNPDKTPEFGYEFQNLKDPKVLRKFIVNAESLEELNATLALAGCYDEAEYLRELIDSLEEMIKNKSSYKYLNESIKNVLKYNQDLFKRLESFDKIPRGELKNKVIQLIEKEINSIIETDNGNLK